MSTVLNVNKDNYSAPSLFLDEQGVGVLDSINKRFPDIWKNYKTMKKLDWDENEFDFGRCIQDFKTCDKSTYDMMIKTLAFQWEADSVASRVSPIAGSIVTSSELWCAWQRISDNEVVHGLTYSEIVRNSFENPRDILNEIMKVEQTFSRLNIVHKTLDEISKAAHLYAAGEKENDQEMYNHCFMFAVTMLVLERIQFMSSFAITFAICNTGLFEQIGKAVQKIAQDELEVHCELDKHVINNEMKTERGKKAYEQLLPKIKAMIEEVRDSEHVWVDYLFSEGRSLVGVNAEMVKRWADYNCGFVTRFLGIEVDFKTPKENPLKFMNNWLDISSQQNSNQETPNNQYKVNVIVRDDEDKEYDFDL